MTAMPKKILGAENEDANAAPPGAIRPGRDAVRQSGLLRRTLLRSPAANGPPPAGIGFAPG
ncbi:MULTISPECIES: hypothetical protein [unclassified Burkholderia]|uniref:hypothetical protein n=1 Tax=unclassified Burkholderia TaxID=2613784 RepID=UPI00117BF6DE|nr:MULTISPECIES: hypothetical protein [unclassified Burkholderia]MDN7429481.1 hypothetical protein [Burkholderia sp. AU45388]